MKNAVTGCIFAALAILACAPLARSEDACPPLKRVASVDMTMAKNGLVAVPVTLAGETVMFLLDTNASQSQISEALADKLKLPRAHSTVTTVDLHGRTTNAVMLAHDFSIGRAHFPSVRLTQMTTSPKPEMPQGILGGDILRAYDVDLDFATKTLNLISREHCAGSAVYWPSETLAVIKTLVGDDNRIYFKMQLDGHEMETVLDTGMQMTALNQRVAKTVLGVDVDADDGLSRTKSKERSLPRHRFQSLSVPGLQIDRPNILLLPDMAGVIPGSALHGGDRFLVGMQIRQPDLMLGMSTLHVLHVYIDYANQALYVTPSVSAGGHL